MVKEKRQLTTKTREEIFREKAGHYTVCYTQDCPRRDHCLRAILTGYMPENGLVTQCINLSHPQVQTDKCPMYRNDQPVLMPFGLSITYHDMPGWMEKGIKNSLIHAFSRKRYYEYHNGTRPMTPDVEKLVRTTIRNHGWQEDPRFIGYVEEYLW